MNFRAASYHGPWSRSSPALRLRDRRRARGSTSRRDLHVHLVEVPAPLAKAAHPAHPLPADVACEQRAEAIPPIAHRLVADLNAALSQQVFDVPEAERIFDVQ